jgi:hypothetical protein
MVFKQRGVTIPLNLPLCVLCNVCVACNLVTIMLTHVLTKMTTTARYVLVLFSSGRLFYNLLLAYTSSYSIEAKTY